MSNPFQENPANQGRLVPALLRQSTAGRNQKNDQCQPEVAEDLMRQILEQRLWTEDVMRLYTDSLLPDGPIGRPFQTQFGGQAAGWERTFPRCWLRQNRTRIENELQRRFRDAERAGRFTDKLRWWLQFVDHSSLNASSQVRASLRRVVEQALSARALELARRDWLSEAIERLRTGLRTLSAEEIQVLRARNGNLVFPAGSHHWESYAEALRWYAKAAINLAEGGGGLQHLRFTHPDEVPIRRNVQGAQRAREIYAGLEESHKVALRTAVAELRTALRTELRAQLYGARHSFGTRYSNYELDNYSNDI